MGLAGRFLASSTIVDIAACTAFAGTMMKRIGGCTQGQMSQRAEEIVRRLVAARRILLHFAYAFMPTGCSLISENGECPVDCPRF